MSRSKYIFVVVRLYFLSRPLFPPVMYFPNDNPLCHIADTVTDMVSVIWLAKTILVVDKMQAFLNGEGIRN